MCTRHHWPFPAGATCDWRSAIAGRSVSGVCHKRMMTSSNAPVNEREQGLGIDQACQGPAGQHGPEGRSQPRTAKD